MSEREVEVRVQRLHEGATLPRRMSELAAGFDLAACEAARLTPGGFGLVRTGIAVAIPRGYEGQVRARSGLAAKHGIGVLNAPGTIDADYRGEIRVILFNFGDAPFDVEPGDRVAQLVVTAVAEVRYVDAAALPPSRRGVEGFGHTGVGPAG